MTLDLFERKEQHDSERMGSSFVAAAPCQATEQESVGQGWEQAESVGQGWQRAAMHVQVINGPSTYIWHYRVETRW